MAMKRQPPSPVMQRVIARQGKKPRAGELPPTYAEVAAAEGTSVSTIKNFYNRNQKYKVGLHLRTQGRQPNPNCRSALAGRYYREHDDCSVAEAAAMFGVSQPAVTKWLKGNPESSADMKRGAS